MSFLKWTSGVLRIDLDLELGLHMIYMYVYTYAYTCTYGRMYKSIHSLMRNSNSDREFSIEYNEY